MSLINVFLSVRFWEHAGALKNEEGEGLTTDSNLDETVQTWQSMNLYEVTSLRKSNFFFFVCLRCPQLNVHE